MTYSTPVWLRGLATAEVAQRPGGISEHAELAAVAKQGQQRLEGAAAEDIVAAVGAVSRNVAQGPDGLFPDIRLGTREELDEYRDRAGLNDDLGLAGGTGSDIRQGPSGLELNERVGGAEELDKTAHDTGLDDFLDRRVPLLGEEFPELCRRLDLLINLGGEDTSDHVREVLVELGKVMLAIGPLGLGGEEARRKTIQVGNR